VQKQIEIQSKRKNFGENLHGSIKSCTFVGENKQTTMILPTFTTVSQESPQSLAVGVCQNYCEDIELGLTHEDAHLCSHQGLCDVDCEMVVNEPYVHEQLSKYTDEEMRKSVKAYGVEDVDTFDRHTLEMYVVWLVAGNIVDEE
jgi:hypothetical protein